MVRGTKVCQRLAVRCNGAAVVVHGRHAIAMMQGRDTCLIDEGDGVGPEALKRVERLLHAGRRKLPCVFDADPRLILLGVHSAAFDDA